MKQENSEIWVFADVDDNMVTTVRTEPEPGAKPASWDSEGRVCGFLTQKQQAMNGMLAAGANVVPTTARSHIKRLDLGFNTNASDTSINGYAILANGGIITGPDGKTIPAWLDMVQTNSLADAQRLHELESLIRIQAEQRNFNVRTSVVKSQDLELYVSVKHNNKNLAELAVLAEVLRAMTPEGWHFHHNANAIFLMPSWLGKDKAVEWFIANVIPTGALTIGMGDSLTDLPFMNLCDYVLMPRKSQNWNALLQALNRR